MEVGEVSDVGGTLAHGPGLADAGVADEEHVHVWVHRPSGLDPDLLFKYRGKGGDCRPATEDRRGMDVSGLLDERLDPRFQTSFAVSGCRGRSSL